MVKVEGKMPRFPYWALKKCTIFGCREGFAGDIEEEFEERLGSAP